MDSGSGFDPRKQASGLAVGTNGITETFFQGDFSSLSFEEGHHSVDPGSGSVLFMKNLSA